MLRLNWPHSRRAVLLCIIILLGAPLPGAAQMVKVPYVSISGFQAPLYLGERAGLFKKNQLDAQLIYMPGGSLIVQTLLSGEVGIASLAPPSAVSAWARGAELAIVAGGIERALNVLMVNQKLKESTKCVANGWRSADSARSLTFRCAMRSRITNSNRKISRSRKWVV